jgi:hypothetical protein
LQDYSSLAQRAIQRLVVGVEYTGVGKVNQRSNDQQNGDKQWDEAVLIELKLFHIFEHYYAESGICTDLTWRKYQLGLK